MQIFRSYSQQSYVVFVYDILVYVYDKLMLVLSLGLALTRPSSSFLR